MGDVIIDGLTGANRLVILDANGKIPALDGSAVTAIAGANFSTGTIPVARLDTGTTAGKVVKLDGNAKLPAVSGAALTGVVGATKSASDPTISTNPSGGVGTEWQNTTSGEVFVCTNATAGANIWTNVGEHSGDVSPFYYGGENYGYTMTGYHVNDNIIQSWSFTTDGNATDVSNATVARNHGCGAQSAIHGYCVGAADANWTTIDKFPFATNANATDVGDLSASHKYGRAGQSSETHGYAHGGGPPVPIIGIEKFSFASDGNSTDVGTSTAKHESCSASSSTTHGYAAGGSTSNVIEKHAFATDSNATDVGDMTRSETGMRGSSSETHGYTAGGHTTVSGADVIEKFTFVSDANATDVGNLFTGASAHNAYGAGISSRTYGYLAGGGSPELDVIQKWSFSSDGNSTDVGNLTYTIYYTVGTQY